MASLGAGCTVTPIVTVMVAGVASAFTIPMTTIDSAFGGSVTGTLNVAAAQSLQLKVTTIASGCTTSPGVGQMVVHYLMQ
jgi:hypothetical protein